MVCKLIAVGLQVYIRVLLPPSAVWTALNHSSATGLYSGATATYKRLNIGGGKTFE